MSPSSSELPASDGALEPSAILADDLPEVSANAPGCEPGAPPSDLSRVGASESTDLSMRLVSSGLTDVGPVYLYQWASSRARSDCPSGADLEANGWTAVHLDTRYNSTLYRKEES